MSEVSKCGLCGESMPAGEEMFKYHGYSCDCPEPPKKQMSKLSPSEAVYGFASWLTVRKEQTIASSSDDAAQMAELVNIYCVAQNLEKPNDGWENNLIPMCGDKE